MPGYQLIAPPAHRRRSLRALEPLIYRDTYEQAPGDLSALMQDGIADTGKQPIAAVSPSPAGFAPALERLRELVQNHLRRARELAPRANGPKQVKNWMPSRRHRGSNHCRMEANHMTGHQLTYEWLSSRYTLTSVFPVCCRRAWYQARVHPSARDPSAPHRRWLEMRFPKRPNAGEVTCDRQRYAAGAGNSPEQTHPCQPPQIPTPTHENRRLRLSGGTRLGYARVVESCDRRSLAAA